MPEQAPFPIDPRLSGIAVAYRNSRMIADDVLPRSPVGQRQFKYLVYERDERFTIPRDTVGRKGQVQEVEFGASEETASVEDHALEDAIPQDDIANAPEGHDPVGQATEAITDLIELGREKRVADMVHNPVNYPSGNKVDLTNSTQWSSDTADVIGDIHRGLDTPLMAPNVMVLGHQSWRTLQTHPKIAKAIHGNSGDTGIATRQQVAELFELDAVYVGMGRYNTQRPGQSPSFARLWGDHVALLHINSLADTRQGVTWAMSPVYGDRVAGQWEDRNIGMRGGTRVRAGESIAEVLVASDVGYLIQDVTA